MATDISRDARRRKILDRGSDRLAFITGQARSLPPSPAAPPSPPKREGGEEGVEEPVSDTVGPACGSVATVYELPKCEPSRATLRDTIESSGVEILAESKKSDESADAMQHNNEKIEPVPAYGSYDQAVVSEAQRGKRQTHGMFTAKKISFSISASENIRILCAMSIALMSVLSYRGYPTGGEAIGSLISFRPIYLVLLSDASLIFGVLFTTNWKEKDAADTERTGREGDDWTDQMGKALEVALVLQKLMSAAFLDCCICAVIIICGISFP